MEGKHAAFRGSSAIVSGQYLGIFGRNENLAPEKALALAVLEDAIHCFQQYSVARDRAGKQKFSEAENWIIRQGRDWVFTFDNVCEVLGLDPQYVRRGLRECEKTAAAGKAPRSSGLASANSMTANEKPREVPEFTLFSKRHKKWVSDRPNRLRTVQNVLPRNCL